MKNHQTQHLNSFSLSEEMGIKEMSISDVGFVNDATISSNKSLSPEKQLIYVVASKYDKKQCLFFNSLDLTLGWKPFKHL